MTIMFTLDHSCITGYLRNYDPMKQYFCLLPYNNTSRPLIVPQEYLIHYDDFLLPCNIPTQIAKPLTVIKHPVSSPLDDKDRTYYTALYKQTYSYNEFLFISAKTISFMVQAEQKTEHKSHASPIKNTPDKLSSVLNNRTQCGIYFSTFLFVQATLTLIVKLYKTVSIKYNLKNNITLFSSIAHGFFNVLTARMVSDLHGTQNKKTQKYTFKIQILR